MEENRVEMGDIQDEKSVDGITRLTVARFKSIRHEQSIEIRPLTILAGANSSGKSSIMQPLLLLKQTLEAPYDPGPLRLDGPNVRLTSADQIFSKAGKSHSSSEFRVAIETPACKLGLRFKLDRKRRIELESMDYIGSDG